MKGFAQDLDTLDRDPACKRLAWRHGISKNVLDQRLRVSEVGELGRVSGVADAR